MTLIIGQPRGIPFVRALPNGRTVAQMIEVPTIIDVQACRFIASGGRYFIALIDQDEVKLAAAAQDARGNLFTVAEMISHNGPELMVTVDRLVRRSVEYLDAMQ